MKLEYKKGGIAYYESKDQLPQFKSPFGEEHYYIESVMAGNYGGGAQYLVKDKGNLYWMYIYGDASANITYLGKDEESTYTKIKERLDKDELYYSQFPAYKFQRFDR